MLLLLHFVGFAFFKVITVTSVRTLGHFSIVIYAAYHYHYFDITYGDIT